MIKIPVIQHARPMKHVLLYSKLAMLKALNYQKTIQTLELKKITSVLPKLNVIPVMKIMDFSTLLTVEMDKNQNKRKMQMTRPMTRPMIRQTTRLMIRPMTRMMPMRKMMIKRLVMIRMKMMLKMETKSKIKMKKMLKDLQSLFLKTKTETLKKVSLVENAKLKMFATMRTIAVEMELMKVLVTLKASVEMEWEKTLR